jgi:prepilin peptidase CpaA
MLTIAMVIALAALGCIVAAMILDVVTFQIPDSLSIALVVLAIAYGLATPGFNWLSHVGATALVFGVGLFIFSQGWMGGGDIKLLTGIAAWAGLEGLALQLTAIALSGGALAIVLLMLRKAASLAIADQDRLPKLFRRDAPLPYAVAIGGGVGWWAWQAWPIS